MADGKNGNRGPAPVVPWERLSLFLVGKGEATVMRGCAIGLLLISILIGFVAFGWVVATNGQDAIIPSGIAALAISLFLVFRWMWVEARDIRDDELYDTVITEQPAPRPQPEQAPAMAPPARGQIETEPTVDAQYTLVDGSTETKV